MMTFEQFQATRRTCHDLGKVLYGTTGTVGKGNLYLYDLCIESLSPPQSHDGAWHLTIGLDEWISDDLADLERRLYRWAVANGYGLPKRRQTG